MEQLRRLRTERGLSQARLAARAGLDPSTVNQIERGARKASPVTLHKLAEALEVSLVELLDPKVTAPPSPEPSLNDALEEERRLKYLRSWRAFIYKLVHRWKQDPPETPREIGVLLDTMQTLLEEGAFERPADEIITADTREASEWVDLQFVFRGLEQLNQIADRVEANATAQRRRATFEQIRGQLSA